MDLQLAGRVALVTGASKGIGLAVVRTLLEEGAKVVAASRKTSPELDALAGPNLSHVAVDLTDPAAPAQAVEHAVRTFGALDILVNNAGGPPPGVTLPRFGFLTPDDEDWARMFDFNLFAVVRAIRAALPHLLASDAAAIVNVSTGMAHVPAPMNVDYSAAKAALNNLTLALSEEYGPQGVRVNVVSPGAVRTAWWTEEGGAADVMAAAFGTDRDTVMDSAAPEMMKMVTGRLVEPQEVADTVVQLVSPRAASTTGAEFAVDGGFTKHI
ncbi:SDR family NAD(P)-dependent oxidoreductase [Actinomadura macrotermitis]|uniref:3-alpha-(Or 20-beta)-hydroxysteroid dehydrogenase n=1 Tax=Actinomadura macrotermitis TaxID=2585200 RepID=A0A7K0BW94_9ACTN|nr:SDR family NAD(P)-dependent oxidoreductase [Actinomadura macrotermitis]MQY05172.1 3-alpha-(or 20-beta)-hydroxysteroid dehydrogenase [Actinomadura macrotermitis]